MKRSSGVIMHISSLPGKYGIGTFGEEAYKFCDFLEGAGQRYWQILPLGQTSYGDSPYQSFSAFAGNPYFIDFDILESDGLLKEADYKYLDYGDNEEVVDFYKIFNTRIDVLKIAYKNSCGKYEEEINKFKEENNIWIEDYSLYMAIKYKNNLVSWQNWDYDLKIRKKEAIEYIKNELSYDINFWVFVQYMFYKQWNNLKRYVNSKGIEIIGDIPIYVAADSADAWANPELFMLDDNKVPIKVAGCPPDAFSETGQLWGNPIYKWDYIESTGFKWWIDRIRESLKLYDVIRIDHFRGFESYWQVPYEEETAINGEWVKGPSYKLFEAINNALGEVNIIAEDLGFLTPEVIKFRKDTGYPGMKVLQFAFDEREDSDYLPHNYDRNCVVYTGTHDNDTFRGWFEKSGAKTDVQYAKKYLNLTEEEGYNWGFIRGAWSSVGDLAITEMQDFLDLGAEARMNIPSTIGNNWKWRMRKQSLTKELEKKIYDITKMYGRCD